jgi:hypothetical protein
MNLDLNLRCREGDLALIIREEPGCEVNVGRVVRVGWPYRFDRVRGPSWLIEPVVTGPWSYVSPGGGYVITRPITFADRIEHPDAWLLPLRPRNDYLADLVMRELLRDAMLEAPDPAAVEEIANQTAP